MGEGFEKDPFWPTGHLPYKGGEELAVPFCLN
jgi:hypothetical protein